MTGKGRAAGQRTTTAVLTAAGGEGEEVGKIK